MINTENKNDLLGGLKAISIHSIYKDAPDLLIDCMIELDKILINYKAKNGENTTFQTFTKINHAMLHAFNFISDIAYLQKNNEMLFAENQMLKNLLMDSNNQLNVYKVIESEILKGTINEKIEVVNHKTGINE